MPAFPLPAPVILGQPYQFATIPSNFAQPSMLFFKNTTAAYVYDGSTVTQVTDPDYPALTVPGVAYLNGRIYVMAPDGTIYGSEFFAPLAWESTTIIAAKSEGDPAIALVRHLVYIIALKEHSSEFFIDAGLPAPGSPLTPMVNAFMEVGCASPFSIAFSDNTVYFMSESRPKGRSIQKMDGFEPKKVSTPFVDRILNADDLEILFAFFVKKNGHLFYVLTLKDSAITLVYDDLEGQWHRWTNYTPGTERNVVLTTDENGVTTATTELVVAWQDGDPVSITFESGGIEFTETVTLTYVSQITFTFVAVHLPDDGPATCTPWVESYFPGVYYTRGASEDFLLSETGSKVFQFMEELFQDDQQPINVKARTDITDWGITFKKRMDRLELVGDLEPTTILVRHNDKDYQTENYSQYRPIIVEDDRAQLTQLGSFRRRSHEIRHTDNTALRLIALEAVFKLGVR